MKVKLRADYYSNLEGGMGAHMPRFGLMHYLACFTLFDGDPAESIRFSMAFRPSRPRKCRRRRENIWCRRIAPLCFAVPVDKGSGRMSGTTTQTHGHTD